MDQIRDNNLHKHMITGKIDTYKKYKKMTSFSLPTGMAFNLSYEIQRNDTQNAIFVKLCR